MIFFIKSIFTTPKPKNNSPLKISISAEHTISVRKTPKIGKSKLSKIIPKIIVGNSDKRARKVDLIYFGLRTNRLSSNFKFRIEVSP